MSRTIEKPRPMPAVTEKPVESEASDLIELTDMPASRSEIEVWNASFPKRAWLDHSGIETLLHPRVRPAGHETPRKK
jgi:hypothetical protein